MPKINGNSGNDASMERATRALQETDYFEAAAWSEKALASARRDNDFERMARICLPLQEARRQIREMAVDAKRVFEMSEFPSGKARLEAGCYLLGPPRVGLDANTLRDVLTRRRVPAMVLAREPTTRAGLWPIVAVGGGEFLPVVMRVRREQPEGGLPTATWLLAAQEALGDVAIAQVQADWPADHRVDDLLERLQGVPDHEKLMQALERACRAAAKMEQLSPPRRRAPRDDPFAF